MSEIRVDNITDEAGTGAPGFSQGLPADALTGNVDADRITDALNATGSAPIYACRAWVNFKGTGTISIRDSGNVSSITDDGTGDYIVNFTNAMPDNNYSVAGSVSWDGANWGNTFMLDSSVYSTTAVRFRSQNNSATTSDSFKQNDAFVACLQVFR